MRDLHKVREQEGIALSMSQAYALMGLVAVAGGLIFILGYYLGRQMPVTAMASDEWLIPPDVENESVSAMLARAAEDEAETGAQAVVALQFHDILPASDASEVEAPTIVPEVTVRSSGVDGPLGVATSSIKAGESENGGLKSAGEGTEGKSGEEERMDVGQSAVEDAVSSADDVEDSVEEGAKESVSAQSSGRDQEDTDAGKAFVSSGPERGSDAGNSDSGRGQKDPVEKAGQSQGTKSGGASSPLRTGGSSSRAYTVQVSSFQEADVAEKLVRQLSVQGFAAYKVAAEVNGLTWYRVRIGSFESRDKAEGELQRLKAVRTELNPMITRK